jgi:hypothetical protein
VGIAVLRIGREALQRVGARGRVSERIPVINVRASFTRRMLIPSASDMFSSSMRLPAA